MVPGRTAEPPPGLRRIAAIVALIAPAAMTVLAAVALAGDVPIAVLAVGLVLLANAAIWFALTERGVPRVFGAAVAALDGEALVLDPPLHFAALRVRLPRGARLSPAARAVTLTAGSLSALFRVAASR
ncbi:MAG TPA: hypothetical protein VNU24_00310 [Solirubrobacteraceae bacterium]|jgi:hypothetical protein|nr:hypothetical protein [Solirubrobacteraceae bacterium]